MKTNTHGLTIKGLRKIAGETKDLRGYYSGQYLQLNYDPDTGEAWTDFHVSFGQNSWTRYRDNTVVVGNISSPMTMQEIADMIARKVGERNSLRVFFRSGEWGVYATADLGALKNNPDVDMIEEGGTGKTLYTAWD